MSDANKTPDKPADQPVTLAVVQPAEPCPLRPGDPAAPAGAGVAATVRTARRGAVASICDALKELFRRAPKSALGWVCAGVSAFVVLCGVGIMAAFIMYGWPTMAAKQLQNWEVVTEGGKAVVEVRTATEDGKIETSKVDVPKEVADPKAWALERYGEQRPLKRTPLISPEPAPEKKL